jgi:hypothetical protein
LHAIVTEKPALNVNKKIALEALAAVAAAILVECDVWVRADLRQGFIDQMDRMVARLESGLGNTTTARD